MVSTAPVLEGDMIESSSPADIIFWLVLLYPLLCGAVLCSAVSCLYYKEHSEVYMPRICTSVMAVMFYMFSLQYSSLSPVLYFLHRSYLSSSLLYLSDTVCSHHLPTITPLHRLMPLTSPHSYLCPSLLSYLCPSLLSYLIPSPSPHSSPSSAPLPLPRFTLV